MFYNRNYINEYFEEFCILSRVCFLILNDKILVKNLKNSFYTDNKLQNDTNTITKKRDWKTYSRIRNIKKKINNHPEMEIPC